MNKTELAACVANALGIPNTKGLEAVDAVFSQISNTVAGGNAVSISGFGKFEPVESKPRVGRNPKTGETMDIPAKIMVKFRPGKNLKEIVN